MRLGIQQKYASQKLQYLRLRSSTVILDRKKYSRTGVYHPKKKIFENIGFFEEKLFKEHRQKQPRNWRHIP